MVEPRAGSREAWLVLAVGEDRQHGGNDGYDDAESAYYSWDETVRNHGKVAKGDVIVLWDKRTLLGASVIEAVVPGSEVKRRYSCPSCGRASIKRRKTRAPVWRCSDCGHTFDNVTVVDTHVVTYRSNHANSWVDLTNCLSGADLRALCRHPRSQLSMRQLRWHDFCRAVDRAGRGPELQLLRRSAGF